VSRTRRILGGTAISYIHQATIILVGLWLTPFLLHRIGQQGLGLWLVAGQVLGYLALIDLGVVAILPREVAFASGQSNIDDLTEHIGSLVGRVRRIVRWQVVGLSATCLFVWWILPAEWVSLKWPLALVFVVFVASYPLRVVTATLQGLQELPFLAQSQMVGWALSAMATVALVLSGMGLYALVIGWIVAQLVPALAGWWRLRSRWPAIMSPKTTRPVDQYFHRSIWVSVGQIAQVLLAGSDVLLLGRLLGAAAVVPYACTGKLVTVFANHPQLLMHAAQPALSELRASDSRHRLANVATALTQAMLIMSGALVVTILPVNHFFVMWWVGTTQYGGWWLSLAFAAMMLLRHWNVSTVYTLFCFGYERQISLTSLLDGIVTVVLTVLLVWKWGPIGAPVASIIGVAVVSLPINVRSVAHEMGLTVGAFVATIAPLILRIVVIGLAAALGSTYVDDRSLVGVLSLLVPIVLLYAAAVGPLAWNGPVGPYLRLALPILRRRAPAPEVTPPFVPLVDTKQG